MPNAVAEAPAEAAPPEYRLTIDLNALNHLGINLYSNVPSVISEVVANSWDADAEEVKITIDTKREVVTIVDDGHGMSKADCNDKYLIVGFRKRDKEYTESPKHRRHVMGRKGIGKLSLFSIADTIEVHSVKEDGRGGTEKCGFIMSAAAIAEKIKSGTGTYNPTPIDASKITIVKGTRIELRELKKSVATLEGFLRKRLARRFSIIGDEFRFSIFVNKKTISVEDRDYFSKLEYLWCVGAESEKYKAYCPNLSKSETIDGLVDGAEGYKISGWVGTFDEQKSIEEGNNTIVVQAWGKLIHEDILKDVKEGGLFSKYLIGEIRADFLDSDNKDDIATSDRQNVKENDPRFEKLKAHIREKILKRIQGKWRDWRNEDSERKALANEKIKAWFNGLSADNKKYARQLFSKIESFPIEDTEYKKELYKHGILAFETLALKGSLGSLEQVDTDKDFKLLTSIVSGMDDLEAFHYYQIVKNRLGVLAKFQDIVPAAKEKLIQEHIFNHLWLLDTSWERASTDSRMEESVMKEFATLDAKLTKEEKTGRLDIRYKTAAGKHIIVELKKYDRQVDIIELVGQIKKYRTALLKCLNTKLPNGQHLVEIICVLGSPPKPDNEDKENRKLLKSVDARYITYDQLIQNTRDSYRDYLDKQKEIGKIQVLIESL